MVRSSTGRRKVELVKMEKQSNLQVTFTKRRFGLFKKASELCTLCGVKIAIIAFSPGKKVFSFGHPTLQAVLDEFLTGNPPPTSDASVLDEAYSKATIFELNNELHEVLEQLKFETKRGEELSEIRKAGIAQRWWEAPIEELSLPQLEELKMSMEILEKNVTNRAAELLLRATEPSLFCQGNSGGDAFGFDNIPNVSNSNAMAPQNNFGGAGFY